MAACISGIVASTTSKAALPAGLVRARFCSEAATKTAAASRQTSGSTYFIALSRAAAALLGHLLLDFGDRVVDAELGDVLADRLGRRPWIAGETVVHARR